MRRDINNFKRLTICPVLYQNGWDYCRPSKENVFVNQILEEMFRWYARKGRQLSYEMLCPIILTKGIREDLDKMLITNIQLTLKSFTKSGLYSKMKIPIIKPGIIMTGRNNNVIEYEVPVLSKVKDRTAIVLNIDTIESREDLVQSYDAMISSVWSFYSLNRYPTIYNVRMVDDKIDEIKFTPNQFYIREAKRHILNITEGFDSEIKIYPAPHEVCKNCDWRSECLLKIKQKIKQKVYSN